MDKSSLQTIIMQQFSEYPIQIDLDPILLMLDNYHLDESQVSHIVHILKRDTSHFENIDAIRYGLFNLFIYAIDAMYVPEEQWNPYRAKDTKEYQALLKQHDLFTLNKQ